MRRTQTAFANGIRDSALVSPSVRAFAENHLAQSAGVNWAWVEKRHWLNAHRDECAACGAPARGDLEAWSGEERLCWGCTIWALGEFERWDCELELRRSIDYWKNMLGSVRGEVRPGLHSPPSDAVLEYIIQGG